MNVTYGIGFLMGCLFLGIVFLGVYYHENKVKKILQIYKKYAQLTTYIIFMLMGYLIVYIIVYIGNEKNWRASAALGAILLLVCWKASYFFFGLVWGEKNSETGRWENNEELSEEEKNWCNTSAIIGMFLLGMILFIQIHSWPYLEIASLALSIWLGSYISIQKIQQKNSIQEIKKEWRKLFDVKNRTVPVTSGIFMLSLIFLSCCLIDLKIEENIKGLASGFSVACIVFVAIVLIVQKTKIFKGKSSDETR